MLLKHVLKKSINHTILKIYNMTQIEPIEIFGFENKGVYLRVFAFPLVEDNKVQAVIYDKDDNVLFSYMLIAESYEDVAEQLNLTFINEQ